MSIRPAAEAPNLVKFELLDEIGHGGMATVYRARDVRLGRDVAVKLIHPHLRENKEVAARFIAEARAVAKLRHPGIVEIYDVSDASDKERYLVAELVRGPSLRKLLIDHRTMPPEIGACFGVLIGDALAHAHAAGIVHRDVKPENVLVEVNTERGEAHVKLTDFGIAKVLDAQGVTSTGQVLGSPAHMAPEQIEGGAVDVRADVFSLGVLIYECMAGRLPFEGKNPAQVLKKVLECSFPPPDKERPTVGARWSAILRKAIARHPADRYSDIRKFTEALRNELAELGVEDPGLEIYRYLSDPDGYSQAFVQALVAALIARAQRARRKRDIQNAAADLNRAVAYRPEDQELLRQVTALAQGQWRRLAMRRALTGVAVIAGLGAVVPLSAKILKRPAPPPPISPLIASAEQTVPASATPSGSAPVLVASLSHSTLPHIVATPIRAIPVAEAKVREVLIVANPKTALVSVDHGPAEEVGFRGKRVSLAAGFHTFDFLPPPASPNCCMPSTYNQKIEAEEGVQIVSGQLKFRPAKLVLVGAPANGKLICPDKGVSIGNGSTSVSMTSASESLRCTFDLLDSKVTLPLRAGEQFVVTWGAGP